MPSCTSTTRGSVGPTAHHGRWTGSSESCLNSLPTAPLSEVNENSKFFDDDEFCIPGSDHNEPDHEKRPDEGRHVPGSKASTTYLDRLWIALPRLILRSGTSFGFFLQSLLKKPVGQQTVGPTAALWPMPLPFPEVFLKGGNGPDCELHRAINLEIASLNWIYLGKPRCWPHELRLGVKPNRQQSAVVERFIRLSAAWQFFPEIAPADMGRGASKHEALEEVLRTLETVAQECNMHLGYQRSKASLAKSGINLESDKPNNHKSAQAHSTHPVARLTSSNLEVAQPIVADRIKMEGEPTFDPIPFLDDRSKVLYQDPIGQALGIDAVDVPFPVVKVHATRREKMHLLHKLDSTNRLIIATADQVREFAPNGLFSVVKDLQFDRMILDARCPNLLQAPLNRWILSMGSAANLLDSWTLASILRKI